MSDSSASVLILGGGVAGLAAADYLHACGVPVHLVEKTDHPGGKAFDWACMATDRCRHCGACLSVELAEKVSRLDAVSVLLESRVAKLTRHNGRFKAAVTGRTTADLDVDAVLIATGMSLYDPSQRKDLGYGAHENIITTARLNTLFKQDALAARLKNTAKPAIAFIQCVGSRNREKGRDYCSRVCCRTAVRQANKIKHTIPDAAVTIFNIDLQATGKEFRTQVAEAAARVEFLQGTPAKIRTDVVPGKLTVYHEDGLAGRAARHFDMVVLAVGIRPASATGEIADMLGLETDPWGFLGPAGGRLPDGVYTAGTARGPAGILAAAGQGRAAAHRIALALGHTPEHRKMPVAVFGGDGAAHRVAAGLSKRGYPIALIDSDDHESTQTPDTTCYSSARLERVAGTAGNYTLHIATPKGPHTVRAGAMVIAEPPALQSPADTGPSAITLPDFLDRWDRREDLPQRVLFWLDRNGPERKECVKRIMQVVPHLLQTGRRIIILMEKMLVNYRDGQKIYDTIRGLGVKLLRVSDPGQVSLQKDGEKIVLDVNEATLPGISITIECDLLVFPQSVALSETGRSISRILRQPLDAEGFLQAANVRHRNVGSLRRGIYFAGLSHDEADLDEEINEIGAALDLAALHKTEPALRPSISKEICVRCLTCFRICPHCAIVLQGRTQPEIDPAACFGCSLCTANCPANAIQAPPGPEAGTAGTVVFACKRSAALAARQIKPPDDTSLVPVPCTCSLSTPRILQPLLKGARRVILAPCHDGNCRSVHGAKVSADTTRQLIKETRIPHTRLNCTHIAANEPARLMQMLQTPFSAREVK